MPADSPLRMPGATLMTRLRVYDTEGPDGQRGGTPHVHLLCTEMYVVLAGHGAVEIINGSGFSSVPLEPLAALLFSPGTLHRLINPEGTLELLVIMANSGLPERGDAIVCFPDEWLAAQARYDAAMRVTSLDEAYQRRDRGVTGFLALKAAFAESEEAGRSALQVFYARAAQRTAPQRAAWEQIIAESTLAETQATQQRLHALNEADTRYLTAAQHHLALPALPTQLGFCGHLNRYFDPATLAPEGIRYV